MVSCRWTRRCGRSVNFTSGTLDPNRRNEVIETLALLAVPDQNCFTWSSASVSLITRKDDSHGFIDPSKSFSLSVSRYLGPTDNKGTDQTPNTNADSKGRRNRPPVRETVSMNTDDRQPQAPESYLTFWEPQLDSAPPSAPLPNLPGETKDAYQEFMNLTEETPVTVNVKRL